MTAPATDRIKCPHRKGRTHATTYLSGHCGVGNHATCRGVVTHGCGCVAVCRCTDPNHAHEHYLEEHPVPLPDPFTVPPAPPARVPGVTDHPEALTQPPSTTPPVEDVPAGQPAEHGWDLPPASRPWVDGTGMGGAPLEVMVRAFAMAAGDLHLNDDRYEDYDETAVLAMLAILRAAVKRANLVDAMLVTHLHEHGTWGRRIEEGIGEVRVYRRDKLVRWDERGTAEAIVEHHMEELGGEQPDPMTVVAWLLEAAAIDYYRVGALEALGLDPEEFRHKEKGTRAVDVPVPD